MVNMGGSVYNEKQLVGKLSHVSFSDQSGKNFSDPQPIRLSNTAKSDMGWLWRVTWYNKSGYGVIYQAGKEWSLMLVNTLDGINYELVTKLNVNGNPNETTVRVMPDGEMLMMVRRESDNTEGIWGRSNPPYKEWNWSSIGIRLGGPDFIPLTDNLLIAGSRLYGKESSSTALFAGDRSGNFRKILVLPSGGDTGYPGFVIRENKLYVSYYSSHEGGKASIYFAEIPLSYLTDILGTLNK